MGIMIFPYSHQHLLLYVFLIKVTLANLENSSVATGLEKVSFHSNPKERQAKECSNYRTIALISHASKVMLKIPQARLQQYMNNELTDVQAGFRKGRGTRNQIANIYWIIKKAREFLKTSICALSSLAFHMMYFAYKLNKPSDNIQP